MRNSVIGIGLEGCDPVLLEKWMSQGHLKNLEKVRQQGVYGQLVNSVNYNGVSADFFATEPSWGMVLTGCFPTKTGFWDVVKFNPDDYTIVCDKIYTDPAYPPFYALSQHHQVITFDVPVTRLSDQINGIQIQGWGGHFPTPPSGSLPTTLLPEIIAKHGEDPLKYKDDGKWWNQSYIDWVQQAVEESATKRVNICRDLLQHPHDLFLTVFGDIHAAGHDLYDQSQPDHLLYPIRSNNGAAPDPLLEAYKAIDRAVGDLLNSIPENAYVLFFSVHGMAANHTDVLSMFTLAEFLYRFSFPGNVGFAGDQSTKPAAAVTKPIRKGWSGEIWRTVMYANPLQRLINTWAPKRFNQSGNPDLQSPYELGQQSIDMNWCPTLMYARAWERMKAFALPAFANGHIRINLQGRERSGIVSAAEYDEICQAIIAQLHRLKDARTGKPMVKQVLRTHASVSDALYPSNSPVADLVVVWQEVPTDVVDSPDVGRIGPVTLNRPGGHRPRGFLLGKGPGIAPGTTVTGGHIIDLPPTLLQLMNVPVPDYFDGKPLLQVSVPAAN
jgi:predicted AlkP superfamily phosphohydrolase/phosphomutase